MGKFSCSLFTIMCMAVFACECLCILFVDLILYVPSTIFQLCFDRSSNMLEVMRLAQGHNALTPVRL